MVERKVWYNTKYARNFPGKNTKYAQFMLWIEVSNHHQLELVYRCRTHHKCVNVEIG